MGASGPHDRVARTILTLNRSKSSTPILFLPGAVNNSNMTLTATVKLTRRQLYDQVWSTSMRLLGPKYGLTDVGLAKVCKKYDIPRPPVGYWAKLEHGKTVYQPKLPPAVEGVDEIIEFTPKPPQAERSVSQPLPVRFFDEGLGALAERVRAGELVHAVAADLRGCAAITRQTRDAIRANSRKPTRDRYGVLQLPPEYDLPRVTVNTSSGSEQRALLLVDAIVKTLDALGCKHRKADREWDRSVVFELREMQFTLKIRERTKRVDHVLTEAEKRDAKRFKYSFAPKYDHVGTGDLFVELVRSRWNSSFLQLKDGKRAGPVEDRIAEIALAVLREADWDLERAHHAEIAHQQKLEAEKRAREEAERRRAEEERRKAEIACQDRLLSLVDDWSAASNLRTFIAEMQAVISEATLEEYDRDLLERWLRWASRVADERDPFTHPLENLPERTHPGIRQSEQRERESRGAGTARADQP